MADPVHADLRVLAWNIFHARDGLPGLGPTWASTLLGCPADSGTHLHVNRTLVTAVGRLIARARPDVALLQEVAPWTVDAIAREAGMTAVHALTAPRVGPAGLRGRIGRANPDLVRTHEGNANAVLVRAPWEIVPGSADAVRLAPPCTVARVARERRLPARRVLDWAWERRGMVMVRVRRPGGPVALVGSIHCHTDPDVADVEAARAARAAAEAAGMLPIVLGGDLNVRPGHASLAAMAAEGLALVPGTDRIDHLVVRGAEPAAPARVWAPEERDIVVPWRRGTRSIRVSDHAPVEAVLRVGSPTGS